MAFPTISSVLDNFNRANEAPLSGGGNWALLISGGTPLRLISNQVDANAAFGAQSYWTPTNFLDPEMYVTVVTLPTTDNDVLTRLYARLVGGGGALASMTYYRLEVVWRSAAAAEWRIVKNVSGTSTTLSGPVSQAVSAGDKIGFSVIGTTVTAYIFTGGVWTQVSQVTDAAITATGKVGLGCQKQVMKLDDFVAGNTIAATQKSRPMRLSGNPGAFTREGGGTTNLPGGVNEATIDDATYVQSPASPVTPAIIRWQLDPENPPGAGSQVLKTRYKRDTTGAGTLNLKSRIYQGGGDTVGAGTLVTERTFTGIGTGIVEDDYTLTGGEVALITDRGQLYHELEVWLT